MSEFPARRQASAGVGLPGVSGVKFMDDKQRSNTSLPILTASTSAGFSGLEGAIGNIRNSVHERARLPTDRSGSGTGGGQDSAYSSHTSGFWPKGEGPHADTGSSSGGGTNMKKANSTMGSSVFGFSRERFPEFETHPVPHKKSEPRQANQDMMNPIRNINDVAKTVRILTGMVANNWVGANGTSAVFRQTLPGLARVHVGNETFVMSSFFLADILPACTFSKAATLSLTQEVHLNCPTNEGSVLLPYFKHVKVLLKLRWLLRLHSACCEIDYKTCSLAGLLKGLQWVALQQHAEAHCDSAFDKKVAQHIGAHLNLESTLDDIFDQFQRALGGGWRGFIDYVGTCDPLRCPHNSPMDLHSAPLVSNESLLAVTDMIFIACFLRGSKQESCSDLQGVIAAIEMVGLSAPELPPLKNAHNLMIWAKARTKPTPKDQQRAARKEIGKGTYSSLEKLAQLDAVVLCANIELQRPEVTATPEESAEMDMSISMPKKIEGNAPPGIGLAEAQGGGPPGAFVIFNEKPKVPSHIFKAIVFCLQHHMAFPKGIRERMYKLLMEEYALTKNQHELLAVATTQNIEGTRLSVTRLLEMDENEKVRIRNWEVQANHDCAHLLKSALVPPPLNKSKRAKFLIPAPTKVYSSDSDLAMAAARSLPDLRGFGTCNTGGRPEFKVPLSTGPLTLDPDLNRLRTTGFFIKMPALGPR